MPIKSCILGTSLPEICGVCAAVRWRLFLGKLP